jgi:hypothetical protein
MPGDAEQQQQQRKNTQLKLSSDGLFAAEGEPIKAMLAYHPDASAQLL